MDRNKVVGGLVGLAVGDALGVPVEFRSRESLARNQVKDMRGHGSHDQPPGTWSDDSSLAFCTAESLILGYDLKDMGQRFVRWLTEAYWTPHGSVFDVGGTTSRGISELSKGTPPVDAGPRHEYDNGNGSLMRILPVALRFAKEELPALLERAHQVSCLTHGHPRSQMACGIYTAIARRLLLGEPPTSAYASAITEASAYYQAGPYASEIPNFERLLHGRLVGMSEARIKGDGYVVSTLEAALWCILSTDSYEQAVLKAVNLGEDTDTTGAVVGGLAGIAYGFDSIPQRWLSKLARRDDVLDLAERLWRASS